MSEPLACLRRGGDGAVLLSVHIQPRASANRLAGMHGDALKIGITAPPVDNRANKAVIALLARMLHLPKTRLTIKSGHQSRAKVIRIDDVCLADLDSTLRQLLQS